MHIGVIGTGVLKLGAKGYRGIMKGFKHFTHGNASGAYKALKDNLNITDDQAKEMVESWEKLNQMKAPGTAFEEKATAIISQTGQGAERAVAT